MCLTVTGFVVPTIYKRIPINVKKYLLNTEQTTHNKFNVFQYIKECPVEIIDYSVENLHNINKRFPDIKTWHFPFPVFLQKHKLRCLKKDINVCSFDNSVYRHNILCRIPFKDLNHKWGEERDAFIEKSKILLNIHFDQNYNIFESIKCYHAFEKGCLIVSQTSENMDLVLLKDLIYFDKLENLCNTVNVVLKDYEEIYNDVFSDENISNVNKFFIDYYDHTLKKMNWIDNI